LDTKFLESLLVVVESGSIAGAARMQGLTAAAISQRIRVLEAELDCMLLNRSAHSAEPTSECLRLLPAARSLVRDAERLVAHVDASGLSGPFRLGAVSTALLDFVPSVIRTFRDKAPNVELSVRPGTSVGLYEDLMAGNLDAAITVMPPFVLPKSLECRSLAEQNVMHIYPGSKVSTEVETELLPWIVYDRLSWGGCLIWEQHSDRITSGHILCELDALEMIAMMVAQGSGQAIVPMWGGLREQQQQQQQQQLVGTTSLPENLSRKMVFLQKRISPATALGAIAISSLQPVAENVVD
jgi:DNA-binding transcriptional LysR family regulator